MGYEIKLYLGRVSPYTDSGEGNRHWFQEIASVDLCKVDLGYEGAFKKLAAHGKPVYLFESDGNTTFHEDRYGEPLRTIDPGQLLKTLRAENRSAKYSRYNMAIALLEQFIGSDNSELAVVAYGH